MMTWNYRVLHRRDDAPHVGQVDAFEIIEAYYRDGVISLWSEAMRPLGHTPEELRSDLEFMLRALDAPVLTEADLPTDAVD